MRQKPERVRIRDLVHRSSAAEIVGRVVETGARGEFLLQDSSGWVWVQPCSTAPPRGAWVAMTGGLVTAGLFSASTQRTEDVQSDPPRAGEWREPKWRRKRQALQSRHVFFKTIRQFFCERGFVEFDTPTLLAAPGQEPHLSPFETTFTDRRLYLATSPEYAHKRLLAVGFDKTFEIARSYRNGHEELSRWHQPEFALLEWYRAFADLDDLWQDLAELLPRAAREVGGGVVVRSGSRWADLSRLERITVAEAFSRYAKLDLTPYLEGNFAGFLRAVPAKFQSLEQPVERAAERAFYQMLVERVEPNLGSPQPTLLCDYPARHAALAELNPKDRQLAARGELYLCGVELANAFQELRDPKEQERRFLSEQRERRERGGRELPVCESFLAALRDGMPPAAGIALGLDRLFALLFGAESLAEVTAFPLTFDSL